MNSHNEIAQAMDRAVTVLTRRPDHGLHDDASARACWRGGTRITSHHASGTSMDTDMPVELGGSGDRVSPGWLFRSGIAACTATAIGMVAASEGIALDLLEVTVGSRSDTRGLLGMRGTDGAPVPAGPMDMDLQVRIQAADVDDARLRQLVDEGLRRSPMMDALRRRPPMTVAVQVDGHAAG
jgi:uncharacterized OsmC-like protein